MIEFKEPRYIKNPDYFISSKEARKRSEHRYIDRHFPLLYMQRSIAAINEGKGERIKFIQQEDPFIVGFYDPDLETCWEVKQYHYIISMETPLTSLHGGSELRKISERYTLSCEEHVRIIKKYIGSEDGIVKLIDHIRNNAIKT